MLSLLLLLLLLLLPPPTFRKLFCFFVSSLCYNSALTVLGFYRSSRYLLGTSLAAWYLLLRTSLKMEKN
jgi:hypothetical protein